jgi:hypothetical protein
MYSNLYSPYLCLSDCLLIVAFVDHGTGGLDDKGLLICTHVLTLAQQETLYVGDSIL